MDDEQEAERSRSRRAARLAALVLVAALAALVCWLAGPAAGVRDWARYFQANTVRNRAVLSTAFLAREVLASTCLQLRGRDVLRAATDLAALIAACSGVT